jgi:subtilisin family serine protease
MRKVLSALALLLAISVVLPAQAGRIDEDFQGILDNTPDDQVVSALVYLGEQVDTESLVAQLNAERADRGTRNKVVVEVLYDLAQRTQGDLVEHLAGLVENARIVQFEPMYIANLIRVDAVPAEIIALADRDDVGTIFYNYFIELIAPVEGPDIQPNADPQMVAPEIGVRAVRAPEVWNMGYTGQGIVVATLDTGVDGTHPALASRWRGLDSRYSGNPGWAWFDPVTNTTFPRSFGSHGTHTMGTVCGGLPGDEVGVAPGAQWIHAAVIDRVSIPRTVSDAILSFQWMMNPDGDTNTSWDVPSVCSNSWGVTTGHGYPPCNQTFWVHLDNSEAAGTTQLFSAGNEGSNGLRRPADRATNEYDSCAVAAVDARNSSWPIAGFSSRGPTFCTPDGSRATKPDIAAPGVSVRSSVPGGYSNFSGTSMASPHINGVVALMLSANPDLGTDEVKEIFYATAFDLGPAGEDDAYGWGMIDAFLAVEEALARAGTPIDPSSVVVTAGNLISGGLNQILSSDDQYMNVEARRPSELAAPSVQIEITGTSPVDDPAFLNIVTESHATASQVHLIIDAYDYVSSSWVRVADQSGGTSDSVVTVRIDSNAGRYIQDGNREVKARVGYVDYGVPSVGWNGMFDQVGWQVAN